MTRCRIPELYKRCKIDVWKNDLKSRRIPRRSVKQKGICLYVHKFQYCVIFEKKEKTLWLME